jgi:dihydroxy-acid dehydratase
LNISPEAAIGGNLALIQTGDRIRISLRDRRVDLLVSDEQIDRRRGLLQLPKIQSNTPWEELYRSSVGQLDTGACLEFATKYRNVRKSVPRHSH